MPNKFIQTCRRELDMGNCGFDNDYADSMVRSQWQSRSTNCIYLLYRWLVAIFFTYVVISSMVTFAETHGIGFFFIYFTNWGIMINMAVGLMGALIVTIWHFNTDFKENILSQNDQMPTVFKIYWALHNSALVTSFLVTIIYWTFLHFTMKLPLNAMNILSHACNSVVMFLDILIVASPMRLLHVIQPLAFTGIYGLFSIVYFLAGGKSLGGQSYIYPILDWAYPGEAIVVVIGLALLEVAVHMVLFWIYKLRVFLHRRYFGIELILTTKSTKIHENNSYTGTNNGFKATANIIA